MKPHIIVLSRDEEDEFRWLSDGWHQELPPLIKGEGTLDLMAGTPESEALIAKAHECIEAGKDVEDVISRLKAAGFRVTREFRPRSMDQ